MFNSLDKILNNIEFVNKNVLDAGTGKTSFDLLKEKDFNRLITVSSEPAFLKHSYTLKENIDCIIHDLKKELIYVHDVDIIVANYLLESVNAYDASNKNCQVILDNLAKCLKSDGLMVITGFDHERMYHSGHSVNLFNNLKEIRNYIRNMDTVIANLKYRPKLLKSSVMNMIPGANMEIISRYEYRKVVSDMSGVDHYHSFIMDRISKDDGILYRETEDIYNKLKDIYEKVGHIHWGNEYTFVCKLKLKE